MSTDPNRLEHRLEHGLERHGLERRGLERRGAQRFEVHLPLSVHFEGRTVPGFTQDLSGRGIFFYTEMALPEGAVVELTFLMPSEITLAENMPVRCRGRVLRASACPGGQPRAAHSQDGHFQDGQSQAGQSQAGQRAGIAVQFDSYEYLAADEPITQFVRVSAASSAGTSSITSPR
jgi:hypothetical protein